MLRDEGQNGPTTTVQYTAADLPKTIPASTTSAAGQTTPGSVSSTITVPDSFVIEGDKTAAGKSVMQVQLNLTYPNDPDLTATLYHYDPTGTLLGQVILFSAWGSGTNTANFNNTVFDDNAATPIQEGSAPFFATYNPQQSLATVFAPRGQQGMNVQGTWTLVIQNNSTTGTTGTFNGWSLTFQKPLPTSGLGEPGSDDATVSFRIFTLGQTDALSSQAWTAVGAATSSTDEAGRGQRHRRRSLRPLGQHGLCRRRQRRHLEDDRLPDDQPRRPDLDPADQLRPHLRRQHRQHRRLPPEQQPQPVDHHRRHRRRHQRREHTDAPGVGFLISDGRRRHLEPLRQHRQRLDCTRRQRHSCRSTPPARDREFVGTTAYQVAVDPQLTPTGQVIIYAALSGPNGGIWRSEDTGQTWTQVLAGKATSVVLDPDSGIVLDPITGTDVQGNLQIVYAGIQRRRAST